MVSMAAPFKHKDSGVYFFRKVIPEDLRGKLGKREYRYSLKTKDPKIAKARFIEELARVESLMREAREGKKAISQRQALALAGTWLKKALDDDEILRDQGKKPEIELSFIQSTEEGSLSVYDLELEQLAEAIEGRKAGQWVIQEINSTLEDHALPTPEENTESYRQLVDEFASAKYRYYSTMRERADGKWRKVELDKVYPALDKPDRTSGSMIGEGKSLHDILLDWHRETKANDKTASEYKKSITEFEKINGKYSVQFITKTHVRDYKDHMVKQGTLKAATINKRLTGIKSLMSYALTNGYIDANPAAEMRVKINDKGRDGRLPFSSEDVKAIFSSDVFTDNYRPKGGAGEAAYWLPLLAFYTGAREEELGQLYINDIQAEKGVHYIELTSLGENIEDNTKSFKTGKKNHRVIPLHSDLIALGFLGYVKNTSKASKLLFPLLTENRNGSKTQSWSQWWHRYQREQIGITDPKKVFHSFRHTFIRLGREASIPDDMLRALTGHTGDNRDAHKGYGSWSSPRGGSYPFSPAELAKVIEKIPGGIPTIIKPPKS